jgi:uncharacterized membrane protein
MWAGLYFFSTMESGRVVANMNMLPYLIIGGIICVAALIGTIMVGVNPRDDEYEKKSGKHFTNLSIIYAVTFIPALILTVVYYVYF